MFFIVLSIIEGLIILGLLFWRETPKPKEKQTIFVTKDHIEGNILPAITAWVTMFDGTTKQITLTVRKGRAYTYTFLGKQYTTQGPFIQIEGEIYKPEQFWNSVIEINGHSVVNLSTPK